MFTCHLCSQQFARNDNLRRHLSKVHKLLDVYSCPFCTERFITFTELQRHKRTAHTNFVCRTCNQNFSSLRALQTHNTQEHRSRVDRLPTPPDVPPFRVESSAFNSFFTQYVLDRARDNEDIAEYFHNIENELHTLFTEMYSVVQQYKFLVCLHATLRKIVSSNGDEEGGEEEEERMPIYLCSGVHTVLTIDTISRELNSVIQKIEDKLELFQKNGSGWIVESLDRCTIHFGKYKPLSGGCHFRLDSFLQRKRSILNVSAPDNKCFLYSVLAALHPLDVHNRPHLSRHYDPCLNEFDVNNLRFPTPVTDVHRNLNVLTI